LNQPTQQRPRTPSQSSASCRPARRRPTASVPSLVAWRVGCAQSRGVARKSWRRKARQARLGRPVPPPGDTGRISALIR
jgi:hypothetical protein